MKYYLGVDGGGTVTTAAVCNEAGELLCRAEGGTINFYSAGFFVSRENLRKLIDEIYGKIGELQFEAAVIGCSALDCRADSNTVDALCKDVINSKTICMDSDLYIILEGYKPELKKCIAICGTGSMVVGEDGNGRTVTKGGWGHILGDEGSGYAIGLEALRKCCIMYDSGITSPLIEKACEHFGIDDFRCVIDKIYSESTNKDYIAGFCKSVCALLETDSVSRDILLNEAHSFAVTVLNALKDIGAVQLLVLHGGLFENNEFFTEVFTGDIREVFPALEIEHLERTPEECALDIARKFR